MWIKVTDKDAIYLCKFYYKKLIYGDWNQLTQHTDINIQEFSKKLEDEGYFWVDENIVNFVAYLNKKGFKTIASCSGHVYSDYPGFYVMFESKDYKWSDFEIPPIAIDYNRDPECLILDGGLRIGFSFDSYFGSNTVLNTLESYCNFKLKPRYMGYSLDNTIDEMPDDIKSTFIRGSYNGT